MAKKTTKKRRRPARDIELELAHERLSALDDAVHAAIGAIARHLGPDVAVPAVVDALLRSAANAVWHTTAMTESEFATSARGAFQDMATAHADCERGQPPAAATSRGDLH